LVTHAAEVAERAERLITLHDGRIVEDVPHRSRAPAHGGGRLAQ
jgi:ABC-type uncharacterized transport system ATPase component